MSYDMEFINPITKEVVMMQEPKQFVGGTCRIGEDYNADYNITYNYSKWYYDKICNENGIRSLYGKKAPDIVVELAKAIIKFEDIETTNNYWDATEGNARAALVGLLFIASRVPLDSILVGD